MHKYILISIIVLSLLVPISASALLGAPCPPGFIGFEPDCVPETPPTPDPIIVIPGITGSWNWDVLFHDSAATLENWKFPPFTNVYQPLVDALRNEFTSQGLNPDKYVFIAFYDWRQPNVLSTQQYLKPIIDKAKQESGKEKVDIIAHSMGGILARAYIQGGHYENDVDRLFTLGTPHYGSSDVYTLWEGGHLPLNWDLRSYISFTLYFFFGHRAFADGQKYTTVQTSILSLRDLLPTYDYLKEQSTGDIKQTSSLQEQNTTLNTFNANIDNLPNLVGSVTTIAGNDQATVAEIPVVDRSVGDEPLWADGKPDPLDPEKNNNEGDNRVLLSSAHIQTVVDQVTLTGVKHGDLPSRSANEIFARLNLSDPGELTLVPEPESVLSFWFASPVVPTITAPDGKIISLELNEIPDGIYFGEDDPLGMKMIIIPNPIDGEYKIDLLGNGVGHYDFASAYFKQDFPESIQTFWGEIIPNQEVSYSTTLNESNPNPIESKQVVTHESLKKIIKLFFSQGLIKKKAVVDALIALVKAHQKSPPRGKLAIAKAFEIVVKGFQKLKWIEPVAANTLIEQIRAVQ